MSAYFCDFMAFAVAAAEPACILLAKYYYYYYYVKNFIDNTNCEKQQQNQRPSLYRSPAITIALHYYYN